MGIISEKKYVIIKALHATLHAIWSDQAKGYGTKNEGHVENSRSY